MRPRSDLFETVATNDAKPFLRCHRGTQEGAIYPLECGVVFIKPTLFLPADEIASINAGRGGGSGQTRFVDLIIETVNDDKAYEFTNIDREELPALQKYVKGYLEARAAAAAGNGRRTATRTTMTTMRTVTRATVLMTILVTMRMSTWMKTMKTKRRQTTRRADDYLSRSRRRRNREKTLTIVKEEPEENDETRMLTCKVLPKNRCSSSPLPAAKERGCALADLTSSDATLQPQWTQLRPSRQPIRGHFKKTQARGRRER